MLHSAVPEHQLISTHYSKKKINLIPEAYPSPIKKFHVVKLVFPFFSRNACKHVELFWELLPGLLIYVDIWYHQRGNTTIKFGHVLRACIDQFRHVVGLRWVSMCLAGGLTPYIPTYSTFPITSKVPRSQYIKHFIRFINSNWHYRRIKHLLEYRRWNQ